jgi:molybdopterin/thiamine biosynthesis adenylyltransferase
MTGEERTLGTQGDDRYSRQILHAPIGAEGQARLRAARVLLTGCGGLGAEAASLLARAGVGVLRIVDRDVVELTNLQRQALFDEADVRDCIPKAVAAARHLAAINSEVAIEPVVTDLHAGNLAGLIEDVDLVVDGFDNFEGRYLLNDACVSAGLPWVHGACVGSYGVSTLIVPGKTPCFRCLQPEIPPPGSTPTCDTVGILGPAAHLIAALEVAQALRWLVTREAPQPPVLVSADVWDLRFQHVELPPRDPRCPCCGERRFEFLAGGPVPAEALCGRDAVLVRPSSGAAPDFAAITARLRRAPVEGGTEEVLANEFVLRFRKPPHELTLFTDGRAIVKGTDDPALARSLVARYFGV